MGKKKRGGRNSSSTLVPYDHRGRLQKRRKGDNERLAYTASRKAERLSTTWKGGLAVEMKLEVTKLYRQRKAVEGERIGVFSTGWALSDRTQCRKKSD